MVSKRNARNLSPGEFRLMGILWSKGPQTLAEVYAAQTGQLAYTTIQTQLNRLVAKKMVARTRHRPMKFRPLVATTTATSPLLSLLIQTVGQGSLIPLMEQILAVIPIQKEDAKQLKQMIDVAARKRSVRPKSGETTRSRG